MPSNCSDEIRSHIVAEAGEDFSLQGILEENNKRTGDDSLMGSVAERTDNIINDSGGALNTSDELIENTVNVSGTLGPMNAYSIVSSGAKPLQ